MLLVPMMIMMRAVLPILALPVRMMRLVLIAMLVGDDVDNDVRDIGDVDDQDGKCDDGEDN